MAWMPDSNSDLLLAWYDRAGRILPWRIRPEDRAAGAVADPYRVWLSEIMLQQTRVPVVIPYFEKFVARWPTVNALARADGNDVMDAWAGLGYYARARNLHACAVEVDSQFSGNFPRTVQQLGALPGVGPYTAAAIAAIALDVPVAAVDGNVERVIARLHAIESPLPAARREIRERAERMVPGFRPGDYAQALMDLGATVCTPRAPNCGACPWAGACRARARGIARELPRRTTRKARPVRWGVVFLARNVDGSVLLERRPARGLLGGMLGLPGTEWREWPPGEEEIRTAAPFSGEWRPVKGGVRHVFTHFELRLEVRIATVKRRRAPKRGEWVAVADLERASLPSAMRKAINLVDPCGFDSN